ncbi:MAG TPA: hypothetical protein VJQ52_18980 [Steroidobacteraceae bacterium]|nr:hypothetical protein [Steroidobacteraceae bacterium]
MSTDPDKDWLDALAGRTVSAANPAHGEGQLLRTMVRAQLAQRAAAYRATASTIATPDPMRERALVERARREGLLPATHAQHPARMSIGWRSMLLAAALAMVAVGIVWQSVMRPETVVVRGDDSEPVQLRSPDPVVLKRQILEDLRAAGVAATGYEALDVQGIDADLPQPLTPEVQRVLAKHGIAAPADGVLRIEIRGTR